MTPYFEDAWLTVYGGDCRAVLREMAPESVHMVCTSPPFWGLRDYGTPGQLGLEATPEEYVAALVDVFREIRRVLRADGTVWLNLGDSYNADHRQRERPNMGLNTRNARTHEDRLAPGLKPKDLVGIPWRVAFALQADGWYLRSEITWCKPNAMPESVTDRPTSATEKLFLFAKSSTYFFDQEAVRESGQPGSQTSLSGVREGAGAESGIPRIPGGTGQGAGAGPAVLLHRQGQGGDEAVHLQRQGSGELGAGRTQATGRNGDRVNADGSRMGRDQGGTETTLSLLWGEEAADNGSPARAVEGWPAYGGERGGRLSELQQRQGQSVGRNLRNWWVIPSSPYPGAHFATFPPKLVEPCVKAGTSERGVCSECGAPWVRVVERGELVGTDRGGNYRGREAQIVAAKPPGARLAMNPGTPGMAYENRTTGWRPSCAHDAAPVPATVLDIFAGTGTVGLVAQSLSRRAILIDLNPDYLAQCLERNRQTPLGLLA